MASRNLVVQLVLRAKDAASGVFDRFGRGLTGIKNTLVSLPALVAGAFSGVALTGFIRNIIDAGANAQQLEIQFASLYGSVEEGQKRIDEIKAFGRQTIGAQNALDAALRLKRFGIEPLDGALQSLVDQNAALGGSQENLEGLILAVGQAFQKQKLQGEEILQLVERGVPVWDLLSNALGKNVQELQEMSSKGQLGREAIKALLDEMGRTNAGNAAAQFNTFNKLLDRARDLWGRFTLAIADAGVFDTVASKLQELVEQAEKLADNGTLQRWAQQIGEQISAVIAYLTAAAPRIAQWAGEVISNLNTVSRTVSATVGLFQTAFNALQTGLGVIATVITAPFALAAQGLQSLVEGLRRLGAISDETAARIDSGLQVLVDANANAARATIDNANETQAAMAKVAAALGLVEQTAQDSADGIQRSQADIAQSLDDTNQAAQDQTQAVRELTGAQKQALAELERLRDSGDITQAAFERLANQIRKSAEAAQQSTAAAGQLGDQWSQTGQQAAEAARQIGSIKANFDGSAESVSAVNSQLEETRKQTEKARDAAQQHANAADDTAEASERSSGTIKIASDYLVEMAKRAEQTRDALVEGGREGSEEYRKLDAQIQSLRDNLQLIDQFGRSPRNFAANFSFGMGELLRNAERAKAVLGAVDRIMATLGDETARAGELTLALARANGIARNEAELLGEQRLDQLRRSIADAERRMSDFADQVAQARRELEALDAREARARGDEEGARLREQELQFAEEIEELEARIAEARRLGLFELVNLLEQQRQRLLDIQRIERQRLEDEEKARRRREREAAKPAESAGASSGASTGSGARPLGQDIQAGRDYLGVLDQIDEREARLSHNREDRLEREAQVARRITGGTRDRLGQLQYSDDDIRAIATGLERLAGLRA